jgi:hypothetical protein
MSAAIFDELYYRCGCGLPYRREPRWLDFFSGVAEQIVRRLAPQTALDAGCAMGFLVEALRDRGVEAEGIDVSEYAISQVREDVKPFCRVGSLLEPFPRRYDLIVCIEVLEHLPAAEAEPAITNLCCLCDDILFSSSPSDYAEQTHFNVQPAEYWAELFARQGFVRDVDFDASFITAWAVRFRRSTEPLPRVVRDYERRFAQLWKENTELRAALGEIRRELAATAAGPAWETAQALQRLRQVFVPNGSRRARWLAGLLRGGRGRSSSP